MDPRLIGWQKYSDPLQVQKEKGVSKEIGVLRLVKQCGYIRAIKEKGTSDRAL